MDRLLKQIRERADVLKKAISKAEKEEGIGPEGRLRVSHNRYYHITKVGDSNGIYIPKNEAPLAAALAKKDYNERFLRYARHELKKLEEVIRMFSKKNADSAYSGLSKSRRELISPYIMTDDLYAQMWQESSFRQNTYMEDKKVYETRRGEKVRSKSEAIIADMLCELKIPYHYEKALTLKKGEIRYPDFTLLHKKTRKELYLEHFGLWDMEEYRIDSLIKLREYRENGIYPGKNLIFTYETEAVPLDIKGIRTMLKDILS